MKKFRTPQEKKRLSYARDGRNLYGESKAGSLAGIRRRKRLKNRTLRRKERQLTAHFDEGRSEEAQELVDTQVRSLRRNSWRKVPDVSLGEAVATKLTRRNILRMNRRDMASDLLRSIEYESIRPWSRVRWRLSR